MCEVWKWIAVGTLAPLAAVVFWVGFLPWPLSYLGWRPEIRRRIERREKRILPYRRLLLVDAGVCFVAMVIFLGHCV
jgi:hypothetical protein